MEDLILFFKELGLSEATLIYILVAVILVILVAGFIASGADLKAAYQAVASEIIKEAAEAGVTVDTLFDSIFTKVKTYLRTPDPETGKVKKINRILCILISLPMVKSTVINTVKKHISQIETK